MKIGSILSPLTIELNMGYFTEHAFWFPKKELKVWL
jgi:hypothetical protein